MCLARICTFFGRKQSFIFNRPILPFVNHQLLFSKCNINYLDCPHHRQGRHFCQVLCSLVNFLNISSKVMKTNVATDSLGATTVRSLPLLGKSSPRLLRRMSRLNNNEHNSGIFFTPIPLKHPKFPCNEVLGFHCFCSTF